MELLTGGELEFAPWPWRGGDVAEDVTEDLRVFVGYQFVTVREVGMRQLVNHGESTAAKLDVATIHDESVIAGTPKSEPERINGCSFPPNWVSYNEDTPKWMVYNRKSLLKWMIWGEPHL